jgi:hypothetical protein
LSEHAENIQVFQRVLYSGTFESFLIFDKEEPLLPVTVQVNALSFLRRWIARRSMKSAAGKRFYEPPDSPVYIPQKVTYHDKMRCVQKRRGISPVFALSMSVFKTIW